MAHDQISPELALVDPGLVLRDTKEAHSMMDSLDPSNMSPPTGINSPAGAGAANPPAPSVESLLFNAGAISADQLGELVRDAVVTQRPVAAIALERGLVTAETMAALHANAGIGVSPPGPAVNGADARPQVEVAEPAVAPAQPAPMWPEPTHLVASPFDAGAATVMPELPRVALEPEPVAAAAAPALPEPFQALAVEPEPVAAAVARPEPLRSLDERVKAVVALAAQTSPPSGAPAAGPEIVAPPDVRPTTTTAGFAVIVRFQSGERLAADSAATFENAVAVARSLAAEFARNGDWPLIAGRCIRPDAVVSVDIERALES